MSVGLSGAAAPPCSPAAQRPRRAVLAWLKRLSLAFVPVLLWLLLFSCGVALIPDHSRPDINVTLLPALDDVAFGTSRGWFEPSERSVVALDLLAAVPYTIHPTLPLWFLLASLPSADGRAKLPTFVWAFGSMNVAAVCTHLSFPTAPPWYYLKHGVSAANYSMKGDPAVLGRLDRRYNMQLFHNMYTKGGKVVFGAWPSLHAAWPYLIARFPSARGRVVAGALWMYVLVVWWAAIYLRHHYLADVLGGALFAEVALRVALRMERRGWNEAHKQSYNVLPLVGNR